MLPSGKEVGGYVQYTVLSTQSGNAMFMHSILLVVEETLLPHVKPLRPPDIDQTLQ